MKCNAHEGVYEQGKEAGEIIGIKIGKKNKIHEIAKKILLLGASIEIIVKSTGLSLEEITEINKEYKCEKSS